MIKNTSKWGSDKAKERYADGGKASPSESSPNPEPLSIGPVQGPKEPTPEGRLTHEIFGGSIARGSPLNKPLRK